MLRVVNRALFLLTAIGLLSSGCGGVAKTVTVTRSLTVQAMPKVPPPPLARVVRSNYRTLRVYRASLSGGRVPEVVVTSAGPPVGSLSFHSADVQVLYWDSLASRWTVVFDAQKVMPPVTLGGPQASNTGPGYFAGNTSTDPPTPILDPKADVQLGPVRFASILPGNRKQLLFSATTSYGGSGVPVTLAVVDVKDGVANVSYLWDGEGLHWQLSGSTIRGKSPYWTRADAHCCPSRDYQFALAARGGYITETADQRPFLGVLVRQTGGDGAVSSTLQVTQIADNSPAAGRLLVGDLIVDVANARPSRDTGDPAATDSLYNKLTSLDAGETAQLVVERGGARFTVPVKLGSLRDSNATSLIIPPNDYSLDAL
jgi:hypothetical protein